MSSQRNRKETQVWREVRILKLLTWMELSGLRLDGWMGPSTLHHFTRLIIHNNNTPKTITELNFIVFKVWTTTYNVPGSSASVDFISFGDHPSKARLIHSSWWNLSPLISWLQVNWTTTSRIHKSSLTICNYDIMAYSGGVVGAAAAAAKLLLTSDEWPEIHVSGVTSSWYCRKQIHQWV